MKHGFYGACFAGRGFFAGRFRMLPVFVMAVFPVLSRTAETGEETTGSGARNWFSDLAEETSWNYLFKVYAYGSRLETPDALKESLPAEVEPAHDILATEIRLDLDAANDRLLLGVKPRLRLSREWWEEGDRDGEAENESEFYVNEWLARLSLTRDLFVSYGRENLQWGPAFLTSPSNPFNSENGRDRPQSELPGMDYGKLIWRPSGGVTLSFLANTDEGRIEETDVDPFFDVVYDQAAARRDAAYSEVYRQIPWGFPPAEAVRDQATREIDTAYEEALAEIDAAYEEAQPEFRPTYAFKADHVMFERYYSLLVSRREGDDPRVGAFGAWHVSDAFVAYTDGSLGTEGGSAEWLMGAFYSLLNGATFCLEYFYNEAGDPDAPLDALMPPNRQVDPRQVYFRRHYLLLQYTQSEIWNRWNLVGRWTYNLDDGSSRIAGVMEVDLADTMIFYVNALVDTGSEDDEFGGNLDSLVTAGMIFTY